MTEANEITNKMLMGFAVLVVVLVFIALIILVSDSLKKGMLPKTEIKNKGFAIATVYIIILLVIAVIVVAFFLMNINPFAGKTAGIDELQRSIKTG